MRRDTMLVNRPARFRRGLMATGVCFCLLLLFPLTAAAQSGGGYDLSWSTMDGGGGISSGGDFTLHGTAGQSDAGRMEGGDFVLRGGFWVGEASEPPSSLCLLTVKSEPISGIPIYGDYGGQTEYAIEVEAGTEVMLYADFYYMGSEDFYWFRCWRIDGVEQPEQQGTVTFVINADTVAEALYVLDDTAN